MIMSDESERGKRNESGEVVALYVFLLTCAYSSD